MGPQIPQRLTDQTAERLLHMIGSDPAYRPGAKLPNEPRLCELFGVSRTTLREAVRSLAAQGYVEVRRGSGTFVLDRASAPDIGLQHDPERLAQQIVQLKEKESRTRLSSYEQELMTVTARISELEHLMQNLYEDKCTGTIPQTVFQTLMRKYEAERAEKTEQLPELERTTRQLAGWHPPHPHLQKPQPPRWRTEARRFRDCYQPRDTLPSWLG